MITPEQQQQINNYLKTSNYRPPTQGPNWYDQVKAKQVAQPVPEQKPGLFKSIGSGLISSERNVATGIRSTWGEQLGAQSVTSEGVAQSSKTQQDLINQANKLPLGDPRRTQLKQMALKESGLMASEAGTQYKEMPTQMQTAGAVAGVALDILTPGTLAKGAKSFGLVKGLAPVAGTALKKTGMAALKEIGTKTAKSAALGGSIGYGYDVTQKLQEGKTGKEALKPGLGTALGVGIPALFGTYGALKVGAASMGLSRAKIAARIDNSLIKPLPKDFRYGKNPGKTMSEMGIVANNQDELIANLKAAKSKTGAELGSVAEQLSKAVPPTQSIKISTYLTPLDDALKNAASKNDTSLLQRLQNVKKALVHNLVPLTDEAGDIVGTKSAGLRNVGDFASDLDLKRVVGDMTKWTNNPAEDKAINKALKQVWGKIDDSLMNRASKASPALASQFEKLNGRYADLVTAEVASKHITELTSRRDLISMPIKFGTVGGIVGAVASGGAAVPAILAGAGAAMVEKAMASTAVKTRVAAWLGKESPSVIQKVFEKNPGIKNALYKAFYKENNAIDRKAIEILDQLKKGEIPMGMSIKDVSKQLSSDIKANMVSQLKRLKIDLSSKVKGDLVAAMTERDELVKKLLTNKATVIDANRGKELVKLFGLKAQGEIPKTTLAQEAISKGISKEEWIKGQEENSQKVFRGIEGAPTEKGLYLTEGRGKGFNPKFVTDSGISVTYDKNVAKDFGKVEELYLTDNVKMLQWEQIPNKEKLFRNLPGKGLMPIEETVGGFEKELGKVVKSLGYDGVDLRHLGFGYEKEYRIYNPNVLKTKSQLSSLYDEAVKGKK